MLPEQSVSNCVIPTDSTNHIYIPMPPAQPVNIGGWAVDRTVPPRPYDDEFIWQMLERISTTPSAPSVPSPLQKEVIETLKEENKALEARVQDLEAQLKTANERLLEFVDVLLGRRDLAGLVSEKLLQLK